MSLIEQFENELSDLIDKFSGMEITNAECIGVLEFQKFKILDAKDDDKIFGTDEGFFV